MKLTTLIAAALLSTAAHASPQEELENVTAIIKEHHKADATIAHAMCANWNALTSEATVIDSAASAIDREAARHAAIVRDKVGDETAAYVLYTLNIQAREDLAAGIINRDQWAYAAEACTNI